MELITFNMYLGRGLWTGWESLRCYECSEVATKNVAFWPVGNPMRVSNIGSITAGICGKHYRREHVRI